MTETLHPAMCGLTGLRLQLSDGSILDVWGEYRPAGNGSGADPIFDVYAHGDERGRIFWLPNPETIRRPMDSQDGSKQRRTGTSEESGTGTG